MKTILIPTDFSKNADNALNYAIGLAKQERAKIILLNTWEIIYPVTEVPVPGEFITEQVRAAELTALKKLRILCARVTSEADIPCIQINRQGQVVDVVLDIIKEQHVDLVVMGTNGAGGLKEIFIGSNTAKVIQKATCPVLAIPKEAVFKGLKKITFATNYEISDIPALKKVTALAELFNAQISLLHISNEHYSEEGAKAVLKAFMEKASNLVHYDNITFRLMYGNNVEEKLDEYVKQKHADLFVMSTLHRSLFERLFGSSLTKTMAYHTKIPLMVFQHSERSAVLI